MGSKWRDIRRTTTADHFSTRTNDPRQMELPFPPPKNLPDPNCPRCKTQQVNRNHSVACKKYQRARETE